MNDILKTYNVSRETVAKLKAYEALVKEWNEKFNLISKSSVENIWQRHILDSVQLCQFISKEDKILCDLGSGAGFPAIVLAIISEQSFPDLKVYMVESIGKKAMFLNEVISKLNLSAEVIHDRIEKIKLKNIDIITSRALAALPKLLEYAAPLSKQNTKFVFPKGTSWEEEVKNAKQHWSFECDAVQSQTEENAKILFIKNIGRK